MSPENVEIVRAVFDATNRKDWDTVLAAYSSDTEWDDRDLRPEGAVHRGIDAMSAEMRAWFGTWTGYRQEIEQVLDAGEQVVVVVRESGAGKRSGAQMDQLVGVVITVRGGLIVRTRLYREPRDALESLAPSDAGSVEVVRRHFEAFEHGGLDAVEKFWHPDIDWRAVEGAADDVGAIRGTQALRRYYEDWAETFDSIGAEVDEVIFESPERCAVAVRNSGRARGSSALIHGRYYVVCTVKDGRIVSGREYETRAQALEAAGLRE